MKTHLEEEEAAIVNLVDASDRGELGDITAALDRYVNGNKVINI